MIPRNIRPADFETSWAYLAMSATILCDRILQCPKPTAQPDILPVCPLHFVGQVHWKSLFKRSSKVDTDRILEREARSDSVCDPCQEPASPWLVL